MTQDEQWRPVVGYEGLYEVSDHGRVRGLDRLDAIGRPIRGRVLSPCASDVGRPNVHLAGKGPKRSIRVSILVLTAFVGPRPDGLVGCHNDGNPANNRVSNLRWDTQSANLQDAVRHGTLSATSRTHCPRRHPLVAPNLSAAHARKGHRTCLACHRALCARRRAQSSGGPFDMQWESDQYYARIIQFA